MNKPAMTEEQMVFFVRNAMLVAGQEMGNGEEWPVVKDTVHNVMKDWEDLKIEREVDAEMRVHLYTQLREMESALDHCSRETREIAEPFVAELREACDAYFDDVNPKAVVCAPEDEPKHVQRMRAIIQTMDEEN